MYVTQYVSALVPIEYYRVLLVLFVRLSEQYNHIATIYFTNHEYLKQLLNVEIQWNNNLSSDYTLKKYTQILP